MYEPYVEDPTWDELSMREKIQFFKEYREEHGKNSTIKEIMDAYNDMYGPEDEYVSWDTKYRSCYADEHVTKELWKYYHDLKNKANGIINMIRRPEDPFNFTDHNTLGYIPGRVIEDKEQLKRIITRLRNQYEQLISTIPNSFL